jgi:photosystem II stability/assembly factor-like uncharacterized protein
MKSTFVRTTLCAFLIGSMTIVTAPVTAEEDEAHPLASIPLRNIGPALTSGRVADFAFHPEASHEFYVAMASAGVWKTRNNGTTWQHVFRNEGAYATGVVAIDPHSPDTVWVGSGENNSQRSVGYGDGVYRSTDGGTTWKNMGLKNSGHISMIRFHPTERGTLWVAAQGPLWSDGGDRGLYKTTDGGETWERILEIDPHTGINEFVVDPADPDIIVASSYQRRRHVWTLINGGPGSGIHKSNDGGKTWRKLAGGLPSGELGRIGLADAPAAPGMVYATIEGSGGDCEIYRTSNFGESWEKRASGAPGCSQYYSELVVDPNNPDRLYALSTFTHLSEDGGQSWERISFKYRHVDDHALWIDPANSDHFWIGGDGGVYETWDNGGTWRHITNLPTVQYYRATPDNDTPFYNVCAGPQDNFTQCGPSRTRFTDGITNADWWLAQFGDGFKPQFDPLDPNIVYAQYQHAGLVRFDRVTGERVAITPQPGSGENDYKWNWNSPLIVSPHEPARLYFGAERVFRSDDRGNSWRAVSGDLTRQIDRNELEVMGRIWSVDAISKNASTSMYGSLIALDESPLVEGLLYAGTDDGLIQVSENGGEDWRKISSFKGVPDLSLIEDIIASRHDDDVAYAVIDNHKRGDYVPYVLKTSDRGRSWKLISNNLPKWGSAHTIIEDHVDPALLFVGTEFGLYFTQDGGSRWHELTSLPTIAVRDLEIQRRETDLVVGTFGLGIWILDDYSALRTPAAALQEQPTLFDVRDSWLFIPDDRRGWGGLGDFGNNKYSADNPPHGAVFSYYLPEAIQSLKDQRRDTEKERAKEGQDNPYPAWDALRREDREEEPAVVLTVRDKDGSVVRRVTGATGKGYHRVTWDLRYPAPDPVNLNPPTDLPPWQSADRGPLALPGEYSVTLSKRVEGQLVDVAGPESFLVKPLFEGGMVAADQGAVTEFQLQTAELYRAIMGADRAADEIDNRIRHLLAAVKATTAADERQAQAIRKLAGMMHDLRVLLNGDRTIARRYEPTPVGLVSRVNTIAFAHWDSRAEVPQTLRDSYAVADSEFRTVLADLKSIEAELSQLEQSLETKGAPWTPGRIPDWP